jgi:hypothetical protein
MMSAWKPAILEAVAVDSLYRQQRQKNTFEPPAADAALHSPHFPLGLATI